MAGILAEIPLGRVAQVEEIAPIVVLLASAGGSYFTGSVVNVSGGHVM
jgi:3-oxoacyl-[acyl-carrier protein] reductase